MRNVFAFASAIALSCLDAGAAQAQSIVTYVSGKGVDSGSCTPQSSPCRSFAYALTQTSAGGEIKALDPDGYGPVTITQAVSLIGVEGAGINRQSGAHITINAGPNDAVNIVKLILDGGGQAANGIVLNSAGSLTIKNCVVQNFTHNNQLVGYTGVGIVIYGPTNFLIEDVIVSNNNFDGINVIPYGSSNTFGVLDRVSIVNNASGAAISSSGGGQAFVTVVNSVANNNLYEGIYVSGGGNVRLSQSTVAQNSGNGVETVSGGVAQSAGNNFVYGNANNIAGTLTNVGMQ